MYLYRIASVALVALTVAFPLRARRTPFDQNAIVLSLGVLSDVHIDSPDGMPSHKFEKALKVLGKKASEQDSDGLDGVLFAGDMINGAYLKTQNYREAEWFKAIYEKVYNPLEVPPVYTVGNHDIFREFSSNSVEEAKSLSRIFGENWFKTDVDMNAKETMECRHCVISDCHIICMTPTHAAPVTYSAEAKAWLDRTLSELTSEHPDRYVLFLTHPMIYGTVYGSELGEYWYTADLNHILDKYPQVITFGGHLHFPLNDPRSIWQGKFTAMGTGSNRYMAIEDGQYENMSGKTLMRDHNEFSQGTLLQFDRRGNLRVTRLDFYNDDTIGEPLILKAPRKDGSHLKTYSHLRRKGVNEAPVLSDIKLEKGAMTEGGCPVSVEFSAGIDDEFVHHYRVIVKQLRRIVTQKNILSDFYRHPKTKDMKQTYQLDLGTLAPGKYEVYVCAYDSWGAAAQPVGCDLVIE